MDLLSLSHRKESYMKDTRIVEKKADDLIKQNRQLVFRYLLENGTLVERVIKPVKPNRKDPIIYRDIRKFFKAKNGKISDPATVNTKTLKKVESVEMPSKSESGNTIKSTIISLLDMGYVEIGG